MIIVLIKKHLTNDPEIWYNNTCVERENNFSTRRRTLKTIQRMVEKSLRNCEESARAQERRGEDERVRDPRTVRFEELNAGMPGKKAEALASRGE